MELKKKHPVLEIEQENVRTQAIDLQNHLQEPVYMHCECEAII
jgi:hypothetical protein